MRWYTSAEVAELIHESADNVTRRCARGEIRAKKLGSGWRVTEEDLLAYMTPDNEPEEKVTTTADRRAS